MPTPNDRLRIERFSFSVRLKTLFFPLSVEELAPGLEKLGYTFPEDIQRVLTAGQRPAGTRVSFSGNIAEKAEPSLQVSVNMERGILGIHGRNLEAVLDDYRLIEDWIGEVFAVNLSEDAQFYEYIFQAMLTVGRDRNPIETLKNLYSDGNHLTKFSEILGRAVANYGIRLVETDRAPTDDTWLDIHIEPSVQRSASAYSINVVSRGPTANHQADEARKVEEVVEGLVSAMEGK